MSEQIATAREWLRTAQTLAVLTGAGISAESGLPTFRGPNGLWRNHRPEQLATPQAFARDPQMVWEWYDWRRSVHAGKEPNAGHRALAELERRATEFLLVTQNVDSLHERAGSRAIVHLHGSLWRVRCVACGEEQTNEQVPLDPLPPRCGCGAMQRPAVVWFGEQLPQREFAAAVSAARQAEVFLVVGTSSLVYPAAALPRIALESGARVIEVNPEATELTPSAHASLRGLAGELLPELIS
ncbi:MAG: SIR2 family NAD-dependent protein deacylase [Candidatus Acidiferrales bacterium]